MQMEHVSVGIRLGKDVLEARVVVAARAALDAMHFVTHRQEQFDEIAAILASDAADESNAPLVASAWSRGCKSHICVVAIEGKGHNQGHNPRHLGIIRMRETPAESPRSGQETGEN